MVWEPVLVFDWAPPSTSTMSRIPDSRAMQFWDKPRLISHSWGEHDRKSTVWDDISIYAPGTVWKDVPPEPIFRGRTVVRAQEDARAALAKAVAANERR